MTVIDPTTELIAHPDFQLVAFDLYSDIHKGIRAELFAVTGAAGSTDPDDAVGWAAVADHARSLGQVLEMHAHHEDTVIEPVLAVHLPVHGAKIVDDHRVLDGRFASIVELAMSSLEVEGPERRRRSRLVYLDLAAFTSQYLVHQDLEERVVMPALEQAVGVEAVIEMHQSIVSSIPPEEMAKTLSFMLPAMNANDRLQLLGGMRMGAPAEVFEGVVGLARSVLQATDFAVLTRDLGR
jgi:hypothetical protein